MIDLAKCVPLRLVAAGYAQDGGWVVGYAIQVPGPRVVIGDDEVHVETGTIEMPLMVRVVLN